jgi:excisionase family DNA binding protein
MLARDGGLAASRTHWPVEGRRIEAFFFLGVNGAKVKRHVGNLRLVIASLAGLLLLLSLPPLRRRLPGLRSCPVRLELLLWLAFVSLFSLALLTSLQTARATELSQALFWATLDIAGQALSSLLEPAALWLSAHESQIAVVTVCVVWLGWVVIAAGAVTGMQRAFQPSPRLGDWWQVRWRAEPASRLQLQPALRSVSSALVDARAAAVYLGVSRSSVYRWARTGQLRCSRARAGLRFNSGDLAALRERRTHRRGAVRRSRIRL